jgi:hypothetical protein
MSKSGGFPETGIRQLKSQSETTTICQKQHIIQTKTRNHEKQLRKNDNADHSLAIFGRCTD